MNIQENVNIKDYCTLKVGGKFRYFCVISSVSELSSLCAIAQSEDKYKNTPILILGGGSNIVFSDGILNVFAIKIEIKGFKILSDSVVRNETNKYVDIKVGAGEIWDQIVEKTVEMNLFGLESLSAIPGTVGACPVQNIGAYGTEVKDTIEEVEVFEMKTGKIMKFSKEDCQFGYRDSIFKKEAKGKYIITAVVFRLRKEIEENSSKKVLGLEGHNSGSDSINQNFSPAFLYPGVSNYFINKGIENPNLRQIRQAIIDIRKEKLPNPKEIPNVGSFFKNPIVPNKIADNIRKEFPSAKFYTAGEGLTKVPAGWLIENTGLKGQSFGKVSVYENNALVLINKNNASNEDIISARNEIRKQVFDKFGITLEQEPELI